MQVSLVCLTINVLGNVLLVGPWGLIGLSAATALAMLVYAIIMAVLAPPGTGGYPGAGLALCGPPVDSRPGNGGGYQELCLLAARRRLADGIFGSRRIKRNNLFRPGLSIKTLGVFRLRRRHK